MKARAAQITGASIKSQKSNLSAASINLVNELSTLRKARPIECKKFRESVSYRSLANHFKECWAFEKNGSSKLSFYNSVKTEFGKEPYLDNISNCSHRFSTTKLRVSAHDLEIEEGRYSNIPRNERICKWCDLTTSNKIIEDESHVLYDCDLYSNLRDKMLRSLGNAPWEENGHHSLTHSELKYEHGLMKLLSPHSPPCEQCHDDPTCTPTCPDSDCTCKCHSLGIWEDHPQHHNSPQHENLRPYILNTLCAFIGRCFDKRWKFIGDAKKERNRKPPNSLLVVITR